MLVFAGGFALVSIGQMVYEKCRKPNRIALSKDGIVFFEKESRAATFRLAGN